jgi:hypothetical protein
MLKDEILNLSDDFFNLSLNQVMEEMSEVLLGDLKNKVKLEPDVIRFSAKKGIKMTLRWERLKYLVSIKKDKEGKFRVVTLDRC